MTRLNRLGWGLDIDRLVVLMLSFVATSLIAAALTADEPSVAKEPVWKSLFDGNTLKNWKSSQFGGEGKVAVEKGVIVLNQGSDMTGITWTGDALPKMNYEVSVLAQRIEGNDFFCGLTFEVGDDPCSLIIGGWGGGVVGISSLNGLDAANNETAVLLSVILDAGRTVRANLTFDAGLLEAIDEEAENRGLTRSAFLASAARERLGLR